MARYSHSQLGKYLTCGKAFEYHYVKKYRSAEQSAALLFGTAIDKATENYAQKRDSMEAKRIFLHYWEKQDLNGTPTDLFACTEIVYGNNDLDLGLLDESDYKFVAETLGLTCNIETIEAILERKNEVGFKYLKKPQKAVLNAVNWMCMKHKGMWMLTAFIDWFDANVEEVLRTQGKIELDNGEDTVIGYYDLVVRLRGHAKPVLLDIKTSGRAYEYDAVLKSPQLALYIYATKHEYEDTNTAGFIVLHKSMKKERTKICTVCGHDGSGGTHKKCNNETEQTVKDRKGNDKVKVARCNGEWNETVHVSAVIQVLVNEVPELLQDRVAENYDIMAKAVKAEIFPRNYSNCIQYNGTVICPFYDLCHKNDMKNIIVPEERK
jgi:hypothetical protein